MLAQAIFNLRWLLGYVNMYERFSRPGVSYGFNEVFDRNGADAVRGDAYPRRIRRVLAPKCAPKTFCIRDKVGDFGRSVPSGLLPSFIQPERKVVRAMRFADQSLPQTQRHQIALVWFAA
jgi:hypothetical protein